MDTIPIHPLPGFREPVCSISHLVGAAFFAILSFVLVGRGGGDQTKTISPVVLSVSSVVMLSLSAVYHMLWPGIGRDVMHRIDIAGVFVLIANTVTPIQIILFRGLSRWIPLIIVWAVAVTGITLRMVFFSFDPTAIPRFDRWRVADFWSRRAQATINQQAGSSVALFIGCLFSCFPCLQKRKTVRLGCEMLNSANKA